MKQKAERNAAMLAMRLEGKSYTEIARAFRVSPARVAILLRPPREVYNLIRDQAAGKCGKCGIQVRHGHIHHRKLRGLAAEDYGDIVNLVYLCPSCHAKEHKGRTVIGDPIKPFPRYKRI